MLARDTHGTWILDIMPYSYYTLFLRFGIDICTIVTDLYTVYGRTTALHAYAYMLIGITTRTRPHGRGGGPAPVPKLRHSDTQITR
jgi:hypothetical protein